MLVGNMTAPAKNRFLPAAALLVVLAGVLGCTTRASIADINRDPGRYAGKEIVIKGRASEAFGGFGNGIFQVQDSTGAIWVLSQGFALPGNGAEVTVTGEVQQGLSFGGKAYGTMFRQTKALE